MPFVRRRLSSAPNRFLAALVRAGLLAGAACLLAAPSWAWQGAEAADASLAPRREFVAAIEQVVNAVDREGDITVSVAVETLDGQRLYERHSGRPMVLASNTKLITTAAALLALPPEHRWVTEARLDGGRLWLVGAGDPSLRKLPGRDVPEEFLDQLAERLRSESVERIDEVVLDDRIFDREFRHSLWPESQKHFYYCAPVSGLVLEGGCLRVSAAPGAGLALAPKLGAPFRVDNRVTSKRSAKHAFSAWVKPGQRELVVTGNLRDEAEATIAVDDPLDLFGLWVLSGLRQRGIQIGSVRPALASEDAPASDPLFRHESAWTLAEAVAVANLDSDNFVTECLLKTMGAHLEGEGSFAGGVRAVQRILRAGGLDPANFDIVDGSGLARAAAPGVNRSAPGAMCALLRLMALHGDRGRVYFDSLPIGGSPGKIASRFRKSVFQPQRVHAKTGWINGASSLSGYLLAGDESVAEQTVLVFSIVVNYRKDNTARTNNARFKRLQEDVLAAVLEAWPQA